MLIVKSKGKRIITPVLLLFSTVVVLVVLLELAVLFVVLIILVVVVAVMVLGGGIAVVSPILFLSVLRLRSHIPTDTDFACFTNIDTLYSLVVTVLVSLSLETKYRSGSLLLWEKW